MNQRLITFLLVAVLSCSVSGVYAQDADQRSIANFNEGISCLDKADNACAQIALAKISSTSPYAKLLEGNIAARNGDDDTAFNLLLPLQASNALTPSASASLHASLALAYDHQEDGLRALEQRIKAATYMSGEAAIEDLWAQAWQALSKIPRDRLIEMRGNSPDSTTQGWIDLALAAKNSPLERDRLEGWINAYPDHPAATSIALPMLEQLPPPPQAALPEAAAAPSTPDVANISTPQLAGQQHIALILPYLVERFFPAADAIEHGFMAAQAISQDNTQVKIYATNASAEEIATIYQQAVNDGAAFIVGPLARDEVTAIAQTAISTPTLALNKPEGAETQSNLYQYGLSFDNEAQQIVGIARAYGMQTATIVMVDAPMETRMAKTFAEAWTADGGQIRQQISVNATTDLSTIKTDMDQAPADMIFFAVSAEDARRLRPYIDHGTPTFGISRIFGGILNDPEDAPLTGIRFIDMPWLLQSHHDEQAALVTASADLPAGEMQRWFALGVDAYKLQTLLTQHPGLPTTFMGLSGKIRVNASGEISRELAVASFGKDGVILEKLP
jgi:outer membrane PBP1 activator LpoA protein